ncbi:MAG: GNAT family N-acetyltransferase [Bacteroidales bacterium]|jgi:diamine N-acetyltransferase|nr:GNAT family N-acetyltransferase [Bacteroidales bacterium]
MIGKKVFLRALELTDVQTLYALENDAQIWAISQTMTPYSAFALEQFVLQAVTNDIYAAKQLRLVICDINSGKAVGLIDLFDFNPAHKRAGVGILIDKEFRNQGFATEALQLLIEYAFHTLELHQLFCSLPENGLQCKQLFEKSGFELTSIRKDWYQWKGKWYAELNYQLFAPKE